MEKNIKLLNVLEKEKEEIKWLDFLKNKIRFYMEKKSQTNKKFYMKFQKMKEVPLKK